MPRAATKKRTTRKPKATPKANGKPSTSVAPSIRDRVVEFRRIPASGLLANSRNPRTHPEGQKQAFRDLLSEIGFAGAELCYHSARNGGRLTLIDGHMRKDEVGGAELPCLILDVDDAEADKLMLTFDPLAALATADSTAIDALLRSVQTGSESIAELLKGLAADAGLAYGSAPPEPGGGGDEFDSTPADSGPTRTAVGDLWVIRGNGLEHRLLVGDCTVAENVARVMGGEKAEMVLTDPPYGIDYGRAGGFSASHGWGKWRENVEWDKERPKKAVFDAILGMGAAVVIWGGNYFTDYLPPSMGWLVWDKGQREFSLADCELAWTSRQNASRVFDYSRGKALQDGKKHPTQKPVDLMRWCIEVVGESQTVYDPYLGSGTTLIAAHRLGRRCYGCELEPRYGDVCLARAEAEGLTVEKAA